MDSDLEAFSRFPTGGRFAILARDLFHELKEKEVELTQQREDMLGQIESDIKKAKKIAADAVKKARQTESMKETLVMELESLKGDVISAEETVAAVESNLKEANEEESSKEIVVGEVKALWDGAKSALVEFEQSIVQLSSELADIKREKAKLAKQAA